MKKTWRSFNEARAFVHALGFMHIQQWYAYSKSGQRPADIPGQPYKVYTAEWQDWYDWLGVQRWLPFGEARALVQGLGLTSRAQWEMYCKSGNKPTTIPADPTHVYADEWKGLNDWLGIQDKRKKTWLPFQQARAYVHTLGFTTTQQWEVYSKSGQRPDTMPSSPTRAYAVEWKDWYDWLGIQRWRSFKEARACIHELGLTSQPQWQRYCSSGNRPADIPADPIRVYVAEWQGWDDWLGRTERSPQKWRPFLSARAYAQSLGFAERTQWHEYCKSGEKPADIPSRPRRIYATKWQGWDDWLGFQCWRPFVEARAYAQSLGFTSKVQWEVHAQSGALPIDIPPVPENVYDTFKEYRDWLGIRKPGSGWRPFQEARVFAHALGLTTQEQWRAYAKAGGKPADIPAAPDQAYAGEFLGWKDWLNKETWRPFKEARAFVHTLEMMTLSQWQAYCASGEKPTDIPSSPKTVYKGEFRGYQDWLGCIKRWNKKLLLSLLLDIRNHITFLQEYEIYEILDQSGVLPHFCAAFPTRSVQHIMRDLLENGGKVLEEHFARAPRETVQPLHSIDETLGTLPQSWHLHAPVQMTADGLRILDKLAVSSDRLGGEVLEHLITNRVNALWECAMNEGDTAVDALLRTHYESTYFEEIKRRFLVEREAVEALPIPTGWAFTDDQGKTHCPNLMQRRLAWMVRERRRIGNWACPGTGKTLSAILASRVIDAKCTVIFAPLATLDQWEAQLCNAYPDSIVYREINTFLGTAQDQHSYLLFNYEKFQRERRGAFTALLANIQPDFLVFDEIQMLKQSGKQKSHRREALEVLMEACPSCAVLGMSATPVVNNLLEAKKLLEIITGLPFSEIGVRPTVSNALAIHRLLMFYGIRHRPNYEQEVAVKIIRKKRNDLLAQLLEEGKSLLGLEHVLLQAKLESVRPYLRKGVMIYTHYIDGIIEPMRLYLESVMGLTVGIFTGNDKSGLEPFKRGCIDVLIGSSAISIGVDGIQRVCNSIVIVSPPWTSASYEQLIGRARRQGSFSPHVEVVLPQIFLEQRGDIWSWDERRWDLIRYKRTLSDCAVDGHIPETIQINPQEFLERSYLALEQWIKRVGIISDPLEGSGRLTERTELCSPPME
jgi:superfamily II DNA or RNA helicase